MANRDLSTWLSKSTVPSELQFLVRGVPIVLDGKLLAARSAKVAALLEENPNENLAYLLRDMPSDPDGFSLVARFCHGYDVNLSAENVIHVTCLAYYLEMTERHSINNLLKKALTFLEQRVLTSWNETIKALHNLGSVLIQQAGRLGLIDACIESVICKALTDPRLLGEPIKNPVCSEESDDDEERYNPNARRRLFVLDWKSEDLTTLPLNLYEPIIQGMNQHGVPGAYVVASICQYVKKWGFSGGDLSEIYERNSQRDVIEAVERLLPNEKRPIPCTFLFEMLKLAISLECSVDCRNGFEARVGKQLDQATVKDLLIPSRGYAIETQYDIDCVRRMLKHFYSNYSCNEVSGLISVAELIEEFLAEVAADIDLKVDTFVALSEMSLAISLETHRNSDGIYKAIDIYLEKHKYLTEMEREEVCKVLDCQKMSREACEHAGKNERLPLRFVVQVLFAAQLQIRDTMSHEVQILDKKLKEEVAEEDKENKPKVGFEGDNDLEKMSVKVMELERECYIIRKEIESGCNVHGRKNMKKGKVGMWSEMKRKFGCMTSSHDCNCQFKKKKIHQKH